MSTKDNIELATILGMAGALTGDSFAGLLGGNSERTKRVPKRGHKRWCDRCRDTGFIGGNKPCPDCTERD